MGGGGIVTRARIKPRMQKPAATRMWEVVEFMMDKLDDAIFVPCNDQRYIDAL